VLLGIGLVHPAPKGINIFLILFHLVQYVIVFILEVEVEFWIMKFIKNNFKKQEKLVFMIAFCT
jgi:hypothetical protein